MGPYAFKLNMVPLFAQKPGNIYVCCTETSSCASKPLLLRCQVVKPQCLCQDSLGLKEVQMGPMTSNLTRCLIFAQKPVNINVLRPPAPKTSSCASKPL